MSEENHPVGGYSEEETEFLAERYMALIKEYLRQKDNDPERALEIKRYLLDFGERFGLNETIRRVCYKDIRRRNDARPMVQPGPDCFDDLFLYRLKEDSGLLDEEPEKYAHLRICSYCTKRWLDIIEDEHKE